MRRRQHRIVVPFVLVGLRAGACSEEGREKIRGRFLGRFGGRRPRSRPSNPGALVGSAVGATVTLDVASGDSPLVGVVGRAVGSGGRCLGWFNAPMSRAGWSWRSSGSSGESKDRGPRSHHLRRPRLPSSRNRPRKSRPSCPPGDRPEQLHRSGDPPGQPGQPGQPERSDPSDRRAHPRMIKQGDRGSRGLDDERGLDLDLAAVDRGTRGRRVVPVVASAPRALAAAGSNSAMCCAFTDGCDHDATSGPANEILAPGRGAVRRCR
jgi:hypothetical protein